MLKITTQTQHDTTYTRVSIDKTEVSITSRPESSFIDNSPIVHSISYPITSDKSIENAENMIKCLKKAVSIVKKLKK